MVIGLLDLLQHSRHVVLELPTRVVRLRETDHVCATTFKLQPPGVASVTLFAPLDGGAEMEQVVRGNVQVA
jgi:hypothetical protein